MAIVELFQGVDGVFITAGTGIKGSLNDCLTTNLSCLKTASTMRVGPIATDKLDCPSPKPFLIDGKR